MANHETTFADLTSLMAACLKEAQDALSCLLDPSSEDVRAVGITLFIEARRCGMQTDPKVRFRKKARELEQELNNPTAFRRLLHEHQASSLASFSDHDTMIAFVEALHEEIAIAHQKEE